VALPMMKRMAEAAGGGSVVGLGGRDDLSMIYIAAARGPGVISLQLDVGSRISLSRSSMGRAYMAGLSPDERTPLLARIREHVGERDWPQIEDGILRSVEEVQSQGFCLNIGEWQSEVSSVGVPFRLRHDDRLLAFNCGGLSYLLPRDVLKNEIGPRLVEMARDVAKAMTP
jgi:DNA-binding IclR family transcriptional regulator